MCGITGFATNNKIVTDGKDRAGFMQMSLMDNMWRGMQSTGVALIRHGEEKMADPEIYKAAVCAFDFINRPAMERVWTDMEDFSMLIGHTRSATSSTVSGRNAHPFQHNHITLVHNGTITNISSLLPYAQSPVGVDVDSDRVCFLMGQLKENEAEDKILEKLTGPFALVWHNARDGSLNFARNAGKPLCFAFEDKRNVMYFSSEYTGLVHNLTRMGIKIDDEFKVMSPSPLRWIKFPKIDNLREFTSRPFENHHQSRAGPRTGKVRLTDTGTRPTKHGHTQDSQQTNVDSSGGFGALTEEESKRRGLAALSLVGPFDPEDLEDIKDYLDRHRKVLPKMCPTGVKKVQKIARSLRALGYIFDQGSTCKPLKWTPYKKNKKQNLGIMEGMGMDGQTNMLMHNVRKADFDTWFEMGKVYVRCLGVCRTSNGKAVVVFTHPVHVIRQDNFFRTKEQSDNHNNDSQRDAEVERKYLGPGGQMVTLARFMELTTHGCGGCTSAIAPHLNKDIHWHGDPPMPICTECQNNGEVMQRLFDPDYAKVMH